MDQEKIGKFIREIRQKEKLSQQQFALKYGVTYQAVSKWENGKNMPDLAILKQICNDYNIDLNSFLETKFKTKYSKKKKIILLVIFLIILIFLVLFMLLNNKDSDFNFQTLSASCENFNLYGSIAYNDTKTAIHISNITYCGLEDNNLYQSLNCTLYEINGKVKTEISKYIYEKDEPITLDDFLKELHFNVDNYEKTCEVYKENSLQLEITAINEENQTITYYIPLKLEDNCGE